MALSVKSCDLRISLLARGPRPHTDDWLAKRKVENENHWSKN